MITYKKLIEKFEDKGVSTSVLLFSLPEIPIFDPSCLELSCNSRDFLYERFKKRFEYHQEKLEELNIWIDHQNYR